MKVHLRHVLAAAFSIIAIVPVLLLGAWVEGSAMRKELASVSEKHLLLAQNVTAALEGYVHDVRSSFQFFIDEAQARGLNKNAMSLAGGLGFRHFYFIEDGNRITHHMMIEGEVNAHRAIANMEKLQPYLVDGETVFSHVMHDDAGRPVIFVVRRISPRVVVVGELGTDIVVKYQQAIAFGRGGDATVVDRLGNIIAHPNEVWREQIKNIAKVKPVARMMVGKSGVVGFFSPSVKKNMISGYTTVPGVGWGVMVPQPMEELEERVSGVKRAALIIIFIGLAASAGIGWLVSGLIVQPVESVVQAALAFAQGKDDVQVKAPALAPFEVRQLADAFNEMTRDAAANLTEQERQRSERRIRGAIASLQEGFALYDSDDRLVLFNEAYETLNPDAPIVMEQGTVFEDVVRARVETGRVVAAKGREEEFIQERLAYHRNPKGTILREFRDGRWIILRETHTPEGGVALTFVDVTELKQTEEALKEREDQYRSLVEGSIQGIVVDQGTVPVFANQAFADIFGYDGPDDILALGSLEPLYAPSDHERITQYGLNRFQDPAIPTHYEFEGQKKDGTYIYVETRVHVATWQGKPAIQSTVINITERRKAEIALRESEERFRAIVDNSPAEIVLKSTAGQYLLVNREFEKHVGAIGLEAHGNTAHDFFAKELADAFEDHDREVLETGRPVEREIHGVYPDGQLKTFLSSKFPVFGPDGIAAAIGAVNLDITERKRIEQALRESEEKNREFASDAAHELRTPLAVFRASLDGLDAGEKTAVLRNEVDRMARLVEQLLALARLDSVTVTSDDKADIHAICVDVAAYLAPMAIKESRDIEVVGAEQPVIVRGNAAALEMAVRNLVENAIKYSSRGTTITIDVSTDGAIRVLDIGLGIPTEFREKAFDRFTRLDRRGTGLGLGLAIVFRVVEGHGGTVDADENPAGGARFTIRVPLADVVDVSEVKIPAE